MGKKYLSQNVLEAFMERIAYIFEKFDHIIVAFSGGKDSGLMLELINLYYEQHHPASKVSVYHIDYEGGYQYTMDYVNRCMGKYPYFDYYHLCMPVSASCGVSMYRSTWMPWNPEERELWVKDIPHGAISLYNNPFNFFEVGMSDYIFQNKFGKWLHEKSGAKRTAVLVAIRTQESLHRYHAVTRSNSFRMFGTIAYSTRIAMNVYNFYPLYDWRAEDIWTANAKFGFDYNKLYDLFHLSGVPLGEMRVANPFHDCGVEALKLYRAIEPDTWGRLVGRINGANFGAIYGGTKAVGYKEVSLPEGHTWKSYVTFLLKTLPKQTRDIYLRKFEASFNYWLIKGGSLPAKTVNALRSTNIAFESLGKPSGNRKYTSEYEVVRFAEYPDDIPPNIKDFRLLPSYKRMCITILKNDTSCKYMGFSQTKDELQKIKEALDVWNHLS
jgi:predicted phosphoadenosine phosphosulfate sulfurtransferase